MAGDDRSEVSDEALTEPPFRAGVLVVGELERFEGATCRKSISASNAQPEGDEAYRSSVRDGCRSIRPFGRFARRGLWIVPGGADREGFERRGDVSGGWACGCGGGCRDISGDVVYSSGDSLGGRHVVFGCWSGALG